ncbi:MAG: hypothetical protein QNK37_10895 [Acidobacteriota bacterium]|nr:hypothetical protein [Acidobacteriota bacterium]
MKKLELKGAQKLERIHNILGGLEATATTDIKIDDIDKQCLVCGLGGPIITTGTGDTCGRG